MTRTVVFCVFLFFSFAQSQAQTQAGGLKGEYFNGIDFNYPILTRVDEKIGFSRRLKSPAPGIGEEFFSIRWSGNIVAPSSGLYSFHVITDDGIRLWVNHHLIIDAWYEQEATAYSGQIILEKGVAYDIRIEYFNTIIHSVIDVKWETPPEVFENFGHRFHLDVGRQTEIPIKFLKPEREIAKPKASLVVKTDIGTPDTVQMIALVKIEPVVSQKPVVKKSTKRKAGEIVEDEPIVLTTVVFQQQRADIPNGAFTELDKLVAYLRKYPRKRVEILGHTDYAGDSTDNLLLSEQRAKAVAEYIVKAGIPNERVTSLGLGSNHPIIRGERIEDRLVNRRVEFVIREK